jgi:hypothetical protein
MKQRIDTFDCYPKGYDDHAAGAVQFIETIIVPWSTMIIHECLVYKKIELVVAIIANG